ncbi:hypothetical protein AMELA_G00291670 [Ameiurus melas]|uniref:Uncharacterized protein n=1 Tax=Ameiurus melas TaxID=219545 RepID=A0A7J5ZHY0_AMEME|nr:hypothetical protein AMELA_G00291670 [Ameiurus melas]
MFQNCNLPPESGNTRYQVFRDMATEVRRASQCYEHTGNMKRLHVLINLLTFLSSANTGSHSLCSVSTFIIGETPFPEFTLLIMLDDITISSYVSDTQKAVTRVDRTINDEEQDFCSLQNDFWNTAQGYVGTSTSS